MQPQQQHLAASGEGGGRSIDMTKISPANFREWILYIQKPYRKIDKETGEEYIVSCPQSIEAMSMIGPIADLVFPVDVRDIAKDKRPSYLVETPCLVNKNTRFPYTNEACLNQLKLLLTIPKGITFSQDQSLGSSIDGGMMESLDAVPMSMTSAKRYFSEGKVDASSVEEYQRMREQQDANFARNKPSEARVQAITSAFQENY
jgi:hypothetical protein